MRLLVKNNKPSSMKHYPDNHKFFSMAFILNPDIIQIDRTSYDLLNLLADIGGLLEILSILLRMLALPFSRIRLKALLTSKVFIFSNSIGLKREEIDAASSFKVRSDNEI
jgi:hypothetical protein